jgi:hypothetical protein
MAHEKRYRELLEKIHRAHDLHRRAYADARSKHGTNAKAHAATRKELDDFRQSLQSLYAIIEPVEKAFFSGDPTAIDDIISFIEVDVKAFSSGYRKERYYRKLKKFKLTRNQVERLKIVALNRCSSNEHRREDGDLRRLMIPFADWAFIERVADLPDSQNQHVRRRKVLMLTVILRNRRDLRDRARSLGLLPVSAS